jgi:hypothetical protein
MAGRQVWLVCNLVFFPVIYSRPLSADFCALMALFLLVFSTLTNTLTTYSYDKRIISSLYRCLL